MASKVTPSTPGAPSFCLAISYATRRVSILQTWTYRPQKRQDGSAFALTYSLRLRSCKSMDAFVIASLPSLRWRQCKWQGPFAPRTLLRFLATPDPSATLSSSADFPGSPVIRPTLLRRFRAGARRASPVAWHVLVTVLSLSPRRDQDAASVRFRHPMLPSPFVCGLGSRVHLFSRPLRVHSHYGPVTRDLPKGDLVDGLQSLGFPPPCHPSYGASDFCPGRFDPC